MQSSNKEYDNKAWVNQTRTITINSDHNDHSHKNEHPDMQASKLNAKYNFMSNTQPLQKH